MPRIQRWYAVALWFLCLDLFLVLGSIAWRAAAVERFEPPASSPQTTTPSEEISTNQGDAPESPVSPPASAPHEPAQERLPTSDGDRSDSDNAAGEPEAEAEMTEDPLYRDIAKFFDAQLAPVNSHLQELASGALARNGYVGTPPVGGDGKAMALSTVELASRVRQARLLLAAAAEAIDRAERHELAGEAEAARDALRDVFWIRQLVVRVLVGASSEQK
ncbi:MAG: hypothetical protein KatS3mg111_0676 [Pirellulaceae bacterium]|nr:MAG: hypothetical protein KatS3mg111_0676 [Pirellulaceae bacterium]